MGVLNVTQGPGAIIFSDAPEYQPGYISSGGVDSGYGYGGNTSTGGMGGGGEIWSDSEQIIWIKVNDAPAYPIKLKPGTNKIKFWVPYIFPKDEWVEAAIIIEAKGYILIPVGFEFNLQTTKDAPVLPGNPKMTDSLRFDDLYDIEIQQAPVPVDLDNIVDELNMQDIYAVDIINADIVEEQGLIEELSIEDVYGIDLINTHVEAEQGLIDTVNMVDVYDVDLITPPVPVDLDNIVDSMIYEDIHAIDIVGITNLVEQGVIDSIDMQDIYDVDIVLPPFSGETQQIEEFSFEDIAQTELINTTILNNDSIDELGFIDNNSQTVVNATRTDNSEAEDVGFEDFIDIELE